MRRSVSRAAISGARWPRGGRITRCAPRCGRGQPQGSAQTFAISIARVRKAGRASVGPEQPRRLLFLYTGMGAQYVGMGRQLFAEQPIFRAAIERCDSVLSTFGGSSLVEFFGGADGSSLGAPISAPAEAQVPNLAMQVALTEMWRWFGVEPHGVIGHSAGELAAAWAAGVLTLEEAIGTYQRGICFQRVAGSMLAVGLGSAAAETLLAGRGDGLAVAARLAPDS